MALVAQANTDPLDSWEIRLLDAQTPRLLAVTFGPQGFVAVGDAALEEIGCILRSPEGRVWTRFRQPFLNDFIPLTGVAYGAGNYVAVGQGGVVLVSPDGANWTQHTPSGIAGSPLGAVTFGHGLFVAVGEVDLWGDTRHGSLVVTSPDGVDWTRRWWSEDGSIRAVVAGPDGFVAAGDRIQLFSPDGMEWSVTPAPAEPIRGLAASEDRYLAVGGIAAYFLTAPRRTVFSSTDGQTWKAELNESGVPLGTVAYGDGVFAAVSLDGGIWTSESGDVWFARPVDAHNPLHGICFGTNTFVAVGDASGEDLATSEGQAVILQSSGMDLRAPRIQFATGLPVTVREPTTSAQLRVLRRGDLTGSARVTFRTVPVSAASGADFTAASGWLNFGPGETEQTIMVTLRDDELPEGTETLSVQLSDPSSPVYLAEPRGGWISITDDDSTHLDHWEPEPLVFASGCLECVTFGNHRFVAAGWDNHSPAVTLIATSTDGVTWNLARPVTDGWVPKSVGWGEGVWVVAGNRSAEGDGTSTGVILRSTDAVAWQAVELASDAFLSLVAHGNGRFVCLGCRFLGEGTTMLAWVSTDGKVWETREFPGLSSAPRALAFGEGRFLAVSVERDSPSEEWEPAAWTSVDGLAWDRQPAVGMAGIEHLTYGDGRWVATHTVFDPQTGTYNGQVLSSPDGVEWTTALTAEDLSLSAVTFAEGTFFALGHTRLGPDAGPLLLTSTDGFVSSPTIRRSLPLSSWKLAWGADRLVVVGGGIASTSDLSHWQESISTAVDGASLAASDTCYVAVGSHILTSPDGAHWKTQATVSPGRLNDVAYGWNVFCAVGEDALIITSSDGADWTQRFTEGGTSLQAVAFGPDLVLATGSRRDEANGTSHPRILASRDGLQWQPVETGQSLGVQPSDVAYGAGLFAVVGHTGDVFTSTDGRVWSARPTGTHGPLNALTYGNGLFVAVGGYTGTQKYFYTYAILLTSPDGIIWTERSPPRPWVLNGVAWSGDTFVAVGLQPGSPNDYDYLITSPDGIWWAQRPPNGLAPLTAIASANGRLIAADAEGRLLRPGAVLELQLAATPIQPWPRLTLLSEVGRRHAVEASADLADWTLLTNTSGLLPKSTVTDPFGGDSRVRFYRARELSTPPLPLGRWTRPHATRP